MREFEENKRIWEDGVGLDSMPWIQGWRYHNKKLENCSKRDRIGRKSKPKVSEKWEEGEVIKTYTMFGWDKKELKV